MIKIAPSILAADLIDIKDEVKRVDENDIKRYED